MKTLTLTRHFTSNGPNMPCTWGVFSVGKVFLALSLELPWLNNKRNVSCIPTGLYDAEIITRKKQTNFLIKNVPGRSGVLVHPANYLFELRGCIAPGLVFSANVNPVSVGYSREAMQRLALTIMPDKKFMLEIKDA